MNVNDSDLKRMFLEYPSIHPVNLADAELFDAILTEWSKGLVAHKRVEIRGLGSFQQKTYESHQGYNPKTGKRVIVPKKTRVTFKQGQFLADHLKKEKKDAHEHPNP